jgi:hypothetical protein
MLLLKHCKKDLFAHNGKTILQKTAKLDLENFFRVDDIYLYIWEFFIQFFFGGLNFAVVPT